MKNCLFIISMVLLSVISITTLICVNKMTESHGYIVDSHRFIHQIDNSNYDIKVNDAIQQELLYKIKLVLLRMEFEPKNPNHKADLKWLISKLKEREYNKINQHCDRISQIINNFLTVLPYLIIFNVILINVAFHKRCDNARQNTQS